MAKMMTKQTLEVRNLRELVSHPLNENLYGAVDVDEQLVESLEKDGIWPGQIQVTTGNVIISGHRRRTLAPLADIEEAVVWVRDDLPNDPEHPDVLDALIKSNRHREKTNEQRLREYALAKEVRAQQAKLRMRNLPRDAHYRGPNVHSNEEQGKARDQAAQDVGFEVSPRHVDDALRALKAAEAAEATRDPEKIDAAQKVRQALNSKITKGIKIARAVGLVPQTEPRKRKGVEPQPEPPEATAEPEDDPMPVAVTSDLEREQQRAHRQFCEKELKWIAERWLPAAKAMKEAYELLRHDNLRLRKAYGSPTDGRKIFTTRYQRAAVDLAQTRELAEVAAALGCEDVTVDAVLLRMRELGEFFSSMADHNRMFTGFRKDNNCH